MRLIIEVEEKLGEIAGDFTDNYKFTGHELDAEAGLDIFHMNARGMDPVLGRFTQIDPRYDLYRGWTPYHYTLNNPLRYTDPTGECIKELPCPTLQDFNRARSANPDEIPKRNN